MKRLWEEEEFGKKPSPELCVWSVSLQDEVFHMHILNYFYTPHVACQQGLERDKSFWGFTALHFEETSNPSPVIKSPAFLLVIDVASFGITQVDVANAGINWGLLKIENLILCGSKAADMKFPLPISSYSSENLQWHIHLQSVSLFCPWLAVCFHWICSPWEVMVSKYSCCDLLLIKLDMTSRLDMMLFQRWLFQLIRTAFSLGCFAWLSDSLKIKPIDHSRIGSILTSLRDQSYSLFLGVDGASGWWLLSCQHWCLCLPDLLSFLQT